MKNNIFIHHLRKYANFKMMVVFVVVFLLFFVYKFVVISMVDVGNEYGYM
jgi:hypothetical protein